MLRASLQAAVSSRSQRSLHDSALELANWQQYTPMATGDGPVPPSRQQEIAPALHQMSLIPQEGFQIPSRPGGISVSPIARGTYHPGLCTMNPLQTTGLSQSLCGFLQFPTAQPYGQLPLSRLQAGAGRMPTRVEPVQTTDRPQAARYIWLPPLSTVSYQQTGNQTKESMD
ncbi:uncharacterized protein ACHE_40152S [Aspergillus chevalieri]|uniref:Uncharacterized protein n=1 Tax=Aspergillus chevalieri TaxID=182096 RepID=A0A7R7ZMK7_ASPCH|nr:uncharacterized protein ACHE_40152S [Aspergillus chevalieri]BCR87588.1 hypothetical protein ACHE_40152S [Aspergillus chevalieri]